MRSFMQHGVSVLMQPVLTMMTGSKRNTRNPTEILFVKQHSLRRARNTSSPTTEKAMQPLQQASDNRLDWTRQHHRPGDDAPSRLITFSAQTICRYKTHWLPHASIFSFLKATPPPPFVQKVHAVLPPSSCYHQCYDAGAPRLQV